MQISKEKSVFKIERYNSQSYLMLYLAYRDLSKKWTMPIRNWPIVLSNFSIIFEDRLEPFL